MQAVLPSLFIGPGDYTSAALTKNGITWILSIGCQPSCELPRGVSRMKHVDLLDEESSDLLGCLTECIEFIDRCLAEPHNRILVHCVMGVSRSAAVVMAYLMHARGLPCSPAFKFLKRAYRPACPNPGFVNQLKLFGEMGARIDESHPGYRLHRLQHVAETRHISAEPPALAPGPDESTAPHHTLIRCRACRQRLATDLNMLVHEPGQGQVAFSWHRREASVHGACQSLFIEPMTWMADVAAGEHSGKLACPKCAGRLGSFDWAGAQCSCGAWITPSFQLPQSRVDVMVLRPPTARAPAAAADPAAAPLAQHYEEEAIEIDEPNPFADEA
eukprot:m.102958 g.102958  ORF g.102958 m.102958 type:complete len:330 (+) comp14130_c1_seq2:128-1117(+)